MTPATEKTNAPRTMTIAREASARGGGPDAEVLTREMDAERQISRLLADMLQTARLECDDPTRRKIDSVLQKYEGSL